MWFKKAILGAAVALSSFFAGFLVKSRLENKSGYETIDGVRTFVHYIGEEVELPPHYTIKNLYIMNDEATNLEKILSSEKAVVMISVPGCGLCIGQHIEMERAAQKYEDINFYIIKTNPRSETCKTLGVNGYPTTFFIRNGEIIEKQRGYGGSDRNYYYNQRFHESVRKLEGG